MPDRRATHPERFTLDQLRHEPSKVAKAAKQEGGCIVVDEKGHRLCGISIPQSPVDFDD